MAEMSFGRGGRALCPLHPEQVASQTCVRCGNFMCGVCSEDGTLSLCPTCRERTGTARFPLSRDNWSVGALLDYSWTTFQREWVMVCVGLLIVFGASLAGQVISTVLSSIGQATESTAIIILTVLAGFLISTVVQGLVATGYMSMLLDVLNGQRADLGRLFTQFHKAVPYLLTMLLIFAIFIPIILLIFGGSLLVAVATGLLAGLDLSREGLEGISAQELVNVFTTAGTALIGTLSVAFVLYLVVLTWLGLPVMLVQMELAANESPTALGTLRRCFAYAKGQRLSMLGVSLLGMLIGIAGFLACCVGIIPAMGLFYLMLAGLYLSLRNGAEAG
ncbi:MAG TPA: B-box zinc finger protein [Myxococcus sp.]|nr:B-box zinc finger protein [Myxococcus sp.]